MISLRECGYSKIISVAASRGGRYGWCAATKMRWGRFSLFCERLQITSANQISSEILRRFSEEFCKNLASSTSQNYISSVNSVMKLIDENWTSVSPKKISQKSRCSVRSAPILFGSVEIELAIKELKSLGFIGLSYVVLFASEFGLRRKEAIMLDVGVALKEAVKNSTIDIQRGSKGGRSRTVERLVPCGDYQLTILMSCRKFLGVERCLAPNEHSLKEYYDKVSNKCLPILKKYRIEKLHDLRVYYACRRYTQITGCVAPCNQTKGDLIATYELDELARKVISAELGHSRPQIVSSYVGRKVKRRSNSDRNIHRKC